MAPDGFFSWFSNAFAEITLDGAYKKLNITTKRYERRSATNFVRDSYHPKKSAGIDKGATSHLEVYSKFDDTTGYLDHISENTETHRSIPFKHQFTDQTIIKSGYIPHVKNLKGTPYSHLYQLETRQATGGSKQKNTYTKLHLGYQGATDLFDIGEEHPAGSLFHWVFKRAVTNNNSSMINRFGKLESGSLAGELYRHQIYDGTFDATAWKAGQGYDYTFINTGIKQQYVSSFGKLNTGRI
mgnify:CR=1 FL=1